MFISAVSIKGGVGKTSLAVHLAAHLHRRGTPVAFLDADPQRSAARWLARFAPSIRCAAVENSDDARGATLRAARAVVGEADAVVADCPPSSIETVRALLGLSDLAIVPTGASVEEIHLAQRTIEMAEQEGALRREPIPCLLTFTRINPRTMVGRDALALAEQMSVPVARSIIHYRTAWIEAASEGATVHSFGSRAAEAIAEVDALCSEIIATAQPEKEHGRKEEDSAGAA